MLPRRGGVRGSGGCLMIFQITYMRPYLRRTIFQNSIGGRRSRAAGPSRRAAATAAGRRSGPGGRSRRAGRAAATAGGRSGRRGGSRGRASRSAAASACVRSVRFVAPGGTRTHNLRLRRATPCPLGHESYEYRHRSTPSRRRPPPVVVAVPRVVAPPRRRRCRSRRQSYRPRRGSRAAPCRAAPARPRRRRARSTPTSARY